MDIRTISATLAILGSGLSLSACKRASTDLSEVPASQPSSAIDQNEAPVEAPASEPKGGETAPLAEPETSSTDEPATTSPPSEVVADTAPPVSATPVPKRPIKKKVKTKVKGEMSCGEGKCG